MQFEFEYSYKLLCDFAEKLCTFKHSSIDPCELVNEAYLQLYYKPFCLDEYKKLIKNKLALSKIEASAFVESYNAEGTHLQEDKAKICTCCKEELPAYAFREVFTGPRKYHKNHCKNCENEKRQQRRVPELKIKQERRLVELKVKERTRELATINYANSKLKQKRLIAQYDLVRSIMNSR